MMIGIGLGLSSAASMARAAEPFSTWDATDAATYWTRSNSDKTVVMTDAGASWRLVRGTTGRASGKYYCELVALDTVAGAATWIFGLASAAANRATFIGNSASGVGMRAAGNFLNNFTSGTGAIQTSSATTAGGVYGFAVDADAGKFWYAEANIWQNGGNPVAGTLPAYTYTPGTVGAVYPALSMSATGLSRWTLRTKASEFSYSPPSGFSAWG